MDSNNNSPYPFETWCTLFEGLQGSPWDDDDVADVGVWLPPGSPDARPAATALQAAYRAAGKWKGKGTFDPEDAVAAVMGAIVEVISSREWTPQQVIDMTDRFLIHYAEIEDPLQDRLDEEYSRMPLEWLGEHGRKELEAEVKRPSELWIDHGDRTGVWVFRKPGH